MSTYMTEEEQLDTLKNWWRKLGKPVLTGVVLVLAITGMIHLWQDRQHHIQSLASEQYQFLLEQDAKADKKAVVVTAQSLVEKFPKTVYANMAKLFLAKYAALDNDYTHASQWLLQVMQEKMVPSSFKQIARIRLARIQIMNNQLQEASLTLSKMDDPSFSGWVYILQGEMAKRQGLMGEAQIYFRKARQEMSKVFEHDPFLQFKLALQ